MKKMGMFIALMFSLVLVLSASAGATELEEYKIKSGMLFNFTYFVEWPPESLNKTRTLNVCIAGDNSSNRSFHQLHGKPFKERTVIVKFIREPGNIAGCNMLFLNRSESHQLSAYLQLAYKRSILTVSDIENFASQGGIIGFIEQNGKVRFEINLDAAQQSKIRINSRLLNLARIISGHK